MTGPGLFPGTFPPCACPLKPSRFRVLDRTGLVVPEHGSYELRVGGERLGWRVGEVLLFDESFRHTVAARPPPADDSGGGGGGSAARIVLIFRVAHPDLTLDESA